jgi:hypothetical protein
MSPDAGPRPFAVALAVARVLAAIMGAALLSWAWIILDNIWHYNDAGTLIYVVLASVLGLPALALVAFALRGLRR